MTEPTNTPPRLASLPVSPAEAAEIIRSQAQTLRDRLSETLSEWNRTTDPPSVEAVLLALASLSGQMLATYPARHRSKSRASFEAYVRLSMREAAVRGTAPDTRIVLITGKLN